MGEFPRILRADTSILIKTECLFVCLFVCLLPCTAKTVYSTEVKLGEMLDIDHVSVRKILKKFFDFP